MTADFDELTAAPADMQAIIDLATESVDPLELDEEAVYGIRLKDGERYEVVDLVERLEKNLPAPRRLKGTVSLTNARSLVAYVKKHDGDDGQTYLFADVPGTKIQAILNGPNADPGWSDHRAVLRLNRTPEWQRWLDHNGKIGDQVHFAEHIEDCLADIVDPPGADLLELAQTFAATVGVEFRSGARLDNGQRQLTYVETVDARAGNGGQLVIPGEFKLLISPFDDSAAVEVVARLRYRLGGGTLSIGYQLHRPDVVERAAFESVLAAVEEGTGHTALHGVPWS